MVAARDLAPAAAERPLGDRLVPDRLPELELARESLFRRLRSSAGACEASIPLKTIWPSALRLPQMVRGKRRWALPDPAAGPRTVRSIRTSMRQGRSRSHARRALARYLARGWPRAIGLRPELPRGVHGPPARQPLRAASQPRAAVSPPRCGARVADLSAVLESLATCPRHGRCHEQDHDHHADCDQHDGDGAHCRFPSVCAFQAARPQLETLDLVLAGAYPRHTGRKRRSAPFASAQLRLWSCAAGWRGGIFPRRVHPCRLPMGSAATAFRAAAPSVSPAVGVYPVALVRIRPDRWIGEFTGRSVRAVSPRGTKHLLGFKTARATGQ